MMTTGKFSDILLSDESSKLLVNSKPWQSLSGLCGIEFLDNIFPDFLTDKSNFLALPFQIEWENNSDLWTQAPGSNLITEVANALSTKAMITEEILSDYQSVEVFSDEMAAANAQVIAIENETTIATGRGNNQIIGVAQASAIAVANAQTELNSPTVLTSEATSTATSRAEVLAIGISNTGNIHTGRDEDLVLGIAIVSAESRAESSAEFFSTAETDITSNAQATADVTALAIGIGNSNKINLGSGHDLIIGWASTRTISDADASSLVNNLIPGANPAGIVQTISRSSAESVASSMTTTLGIINSGQIRTGTGNDIVLGFANNISDNMAQAEAIAIDNADANANGLAIAVARGRSIGIINLGTINTGRGDDLVIGIGIDASAADAEAEATAVAIAPGGVGMTDGLAITNSLADVSDAISIGIDNNSGVIKTVRGNDQIVGLGTVGITGGSIFAGNGNDSILGYGTMVGIENSQIRLGAGDDYLKAAVIAFVPSTGEMQLAENQSGAIVDSKVRGGRGNDVFEIGGFSGSVVLNGGQDHDILQLQGSINDYEISLGSSHRQTLIFKDGESTLTAQNIEEVRFSNDTQSYKYGDLSHYFA